MERILAPKRPHGDSARCIRYPIIALSQRSDEVLRLARSRTSLPNMPYDNVDLDWPHHSR